MSNTSTIFKVIEIVSSGFPWNTIELNGGRNVTFGIHCYFREQFLTIQKLLDKSDIEYDVDNDSWIDHEFFSYVNFEYMQSLEKNKFLISLDITSDDNLQIVKGLVEAQKAHKNRCLKVSFELRQEMREARKKNDTEYETLLFEEEKRLWNNDKDDELLKKYLRHVLRLKPDEPVYICKKYEDEDPPRSDVDRLNSFW
jgi:hypothetical protein